MVYAGRARRPGTDARHPARALRPGPTIAAFGRNTKILRPLGSLGGSAAIGPQYRPAGPGRAGRPILRPLGSLGGAALGHFGGAAPAATPRRRAAGPSRRAPRSFAAETEGVLEMRQSNPFPLYIYIYNRHGRRPKPRACWRCVDCLQQSTPIPLEKLIYIYIYIYIYIVRSTAFTAMDPCSTQPE